MGQLKQKKDSVRGPYLPPHLRDRFEQALMDQDLLNLAEHIAVLDALEADLLTRLHSGASARLWTEAQEAFRLFERSLGTEAAAQRLAALKEKLLEGRDEQGVVDQLQKVYDQRLRFTESERRRGIELQQYVTVAQIGLIMNQLQAIIVEHVEDKLVLQRIGRAMAALVHQPSQVEQVTRVPELLARRSSP